MGMIPVRVAGLTKDEKTGQPVVLLQEIEGERVLPIWIGEPEGRAIALEMAGRRYQRPLTHDLIVNMLESLHARVSRVVICDLKETTFFANLYLDAGSGPIAIDARPSDSIALALRARAPIFVADQVFQSSARSDIRIRGEKTPEEKAEDLRRYLEGLNPEDFGKWNPEET
jgi:hypothetical protein